MYKEGLYEKIITKELNQYLNQGKEDAISEPLNDEESDLILSRHLAEVIQHALKQIKEDGTIQKEEKLARQVALVNHLIEQLGGEEELEGEQVQEEAKMLYAINRSDKYPRPTTPLSQTMLFTNAKNEPNLLSELQLEILSSERIDLLVSFIKWSGLRCLKEALEEFTKSRPLRVITTSYMGASDYRAIEFLASLPNTEVKISYDTKRTKHHAKAYMFHRDTGFSTAYIGSSNVSQSALVSGLEWNVKVTEKDSKDVMDKFEATFEAYWNDSEFVTFSKEQEERLKQALKSERYRSGDTYLVESTITPNYFQKEMLERLRVEREVHGFYKNLVVAATGVGKTVISALDYKRFIRSNPKCKGRLLFVAHKQEILKQSLATFRRVLMDWNFGELYYSGRIPDQKDYLFVTIQTFNSRKFYEEMPKDYYDYIVIDEFHHAAAQSYEALLEYYEPQILLGLTATPERMDGKNVLEHFENRIAAQLRLAEAIDYGLLAPFHYFCITDSIDYSQIQWRKGGYDTEQLDKLVSGDTQRADLIIKSLYTYLTDIDQTTGLGFCVSIQHAIFMATYFNQKGILSEVLHGKSSEEQREKAIANLVKGRIRFIFTVDLFNEGIDIPDVNTVLFLRPTESMTVFIQQLGRGLRLADHKECLTVLDYVGQAHKQYNYYQKLEAISTSKGQKLRERIETNTCLMPKGCHIYMEKMAKKYILENMKGYLYDKRNVLKNMKALEIEQGHYGTIVDFIKTYDMTLLDIYKIRSKVQGKSIYSSYYRLCVEAGLRVEQSCPDELKLGNALGRISLIRSVGLLRFMIEVLQNIESLNIRSFNKIECSWLLMFHYTVWGEAPHQLGMSTLIESLERMYRNKPIFEEILSVLHYNYTHLKWISKKDTAFEESPLEVHGVYSTDQILVALGKHTMEKKYNFQEGVLYVEEKQVDVLFITLNKVEKHYSPSTMYKDYAINDTLFHWQTQSKIAPHTPTCQRYIHHKQIGSKVMIFVREDKKSKGFTAPFTYIGTADYVKHSGSKPVNIIWKLHEPLPSTIERKAEKAL